MNPPDTASRWWLMPNLLALDAPLVAVVWQRFLADQFEATTPWAASIALFAAVWCIYLLDRLLDARRGAIDAARHRTAARHPRVFLLGAVLTGCSSVVAAAALPIEYVRYGIVVGLAISAYLVLVHAVEWRLLRFAGTKELLVATGFVAGVAAPLAVGSRPSVECLPSVVAFGGVCWINCRLINDWETTPHSMSWLAAIVSLAVVTITSALPIAIAAVVAASVLGLWVVHLVWGATPEPARVFADLVLLTPIAFMGLP